MKDLLMYVILVAWIRRAPFQAVFVLLVITELSLFISFFPQKPPT